MPKDSTTMVELVARTLTLLRDSGVNLREGCVRQYIERNEKQSLPEIFVFSCGKWCGAEGYAQCVTHWA